MPRIETLERELFQGDFKDIDIDEDDDFLTKKKLMPAYSPTLNIVHRHENTTQVKSFKPLIGSNTSHAIPSSLLETAIKARKEAAYVQTKGVERKSQNTSHLGFKVQKL